MKNNLFQIGTAVVIVVLLVSLSDPFMLTMPPPLAMLALLVATVLVCLWAGFVLREDTGDERESLHRVEAGRIAYLAGIGVLTLGVIVEGLAHHVDTWLALALAVMIVSKLVARLYFDRYR